MRIFLHSHTGRTNALPKERFCRVSAASLAAFVRNSLFKESCIAADRFLVLSVLSAPRIHPGLPGDKPGVIARQDIGIGRVFLVSDRHVAHRKSRYLNSKSDIREQHSRDDLPSTHRLSAAPCNRSEKDFHHRLC